MCDICGMFPCMKGCPNEKEEEPVHCCTRCGEPIFSGDRDAEICGETLCESCTDNISASEWLDIVGSEWQIAEAS